MDMNAEIISDSVDIDVSPVVSEVDLEISPNSFDASMEVEGDILVRTEKDYNKLEHLPSINGVRLIGNKTAQDLNIETKYPEEGNIGDILMKTTNANNGVSWITPASKSEEDNTRPITAAAVYTEIGNINALLATI